MLLKVYQLHKQNNNQEEIANVLVEEGFKTACSQATVSNLYRQVKGALEYLRGLSYEFYVKNKLKTHALQNLFDGGAVSKVLHSGTVKTGTEWGNYPDLVIVYDNGNIDIVGCKCFNDRNYTVKITEGKSSIAPELDTFIKLHKNAEIKLGNNILKNTGKNRIRLVLLLRCILKQLPAEVYTAFNSPHELPKTVNFSPRSLQNKLLTPARWTTTSNNSSL